MTELKINDHVFQMYKSADELPALRYSRFQKYLIAENGIGSDIESVSLHFSKLFEFFGHGLHKEAYDETKNLFYNLYNMLEGNNLPAMGFACLVHSIDGKTFTDVTESGLENLVKTINETGISQAQIKDYVNEVKKKIAADLRMIAPSFFNESDTYEIYVNIKNKIALLAQAAEYEVVPDDLLAKIRAIDKFMIEQNKPENFDGDDVENALLNCDTSFERLCATLESQGVANAQHLTVMQFYVRLEHFKKINKPAKQKSYEQ